LRKSGIHGRFGTVLVMVLMTSAHLPGCAGRHAKEDRPAVPAQIPPPPPSSPAQHAPPAAARGAETILPVMKLPGRDTSASAAVPRCTPSPEAPGEISVPAGGFTLPELVEIALRHNPSTRRAWASVRAAEAAAGMARGAYWPAIELSAGIDRVDGTLPLFPSKITENYFQGSAALTYLLFDFGGRRARVDATRQALQAVSGEYSQNAQDVVLGVARSYYQLIGSLADLQAAEDTLKEADTNLASARALLEAGLGTRQDVLLMQAQRARANLGVVSRRGELAIARGALATAAGLPANTDLPLASLTRELHVDVEQLRVEELLQAGLATRPDLGAAWDRLNQARSNARDASSRLWPSLEVGADVAWLKGEGFFDNDFSVEGMSYQAALAVTYPLFEGFALRNGVRRANAMAEEAGAAVRSRQETVMREVWESYQRLVTAGQQVEASRELLESAELSYAAALTAYRAGLTTLPELVQAQTTLSDARYEHVAARTAWHVALVQLARDTGAIPLSGEPVLAQPGPAPPSGSHTSPGKPPPGQDTAP